jgi:threonine dehydrogenase-like Zn-dependent dehydrogenase
MVPGYQNVGRVAAIGEGVEGRAVGDRVFSTAGHVQYAMVRAADAVPIPDEVSDEAASWGALAFVTQTGIRRVEHAMGDTAAVIGLGPLGQLVVQYLRVIGLREIVAIDTVQSRVDIALAHGATSGFCGSAADAGDFVAARTDGVLADAVYDVTGNWAVLPMALKLAKQFGKVILIGDTPFPSRQHLTQDVLARQVTILATHNVKLEPKHAWWTIPRQIALFYGYLRRGQMRSDDLTTHRFRPQQAAECYDLLDRDRGPTMGVVFDWTGLAA